jgi:hypothetical protein
MGGQFGTSLQQEMSPSGHGCEQHVPVDLDLFAELMKQRSQSWAASGIRFEFHRGPQYDKSAAWVACEGSFTSADFIVWDSGEADRTTLILNGIDEPVTSHYEVTSEIGLVGCLDDMTKHLVRGG